MSEPKGGSTEPPKAPLDPPQHTVIKNSKCHKINGEQNSYLTCNKKMALSLGQQTAEESEKLCTFHDPKEKGLLASL